MTEIRMSQKPIDRVGSHTSCDFCGRGAWHRGVSPYTFVLDGEEGDACANCATATPAEREAQILSHIEQREQYVRFLRRMQESSFVREVHPRETCQRCKPPCGGLEMCDYCRRKFAHDFVHWDGDKYGCEGCPERARRDKATAAMEESGTGWGPEPPF